MQLTTAARRRASTRVGLALSVLCGAFAGSPALAYDDQSTIMSVLSLIGVYSDDNNEKIEYRDRAKLVLPPNRQALPEPQSRGDGRPGGWPVDQDVVRRRNAQAVARQPAPQPGLNQNPTISPTELAKGRAGAPAVSRTAGDSECLNSNARECLLMSDAEAKVGTKESDEKKNLVAGREPARDYLTEPPRGYRTPTKDGKATASAPVEKEDWSNPGAYIRQQAGRIFGGGE
ncbi:MAG: hypothetical protein C3F11_17955 [Methylocystaceae bacterium]|nr:MAG: hypothetical protein C3F11_17955 [Methylocystaceae bacterium]